MRLTAPTTISAHNTSVRSILPDTRSVSLGEALTLMLQFMSPLHMDGRTRRHNRRRDYPGGSAPDDGPAGGGGPATCAASTSIWRSLSRAQRGSRSAPLAMNPAPERKRNAIPGTALTNVPLRAVATAIVAVTPRNANPTPIAPRAAPCVVPK